MEKKLYGTVLLKAQHILDEISRSEEPPTLNQLSEHLSISKPTIYKILQTLVYCGYVHVNFVGNEKFYRLGTVFLRYAQSVDASIDIVAIATPYLKELRDQTAETVNLGIDEGHRIVLLKKIESTHSIKLVSVIGGKMHMYSSAMGKALLANYSHSQLNDYLNHTQLLSLTDNTLTNPKQLVENLAMVRQLGYAIDDVENQTGVFCLGFALNANGRSYGAFSISMPKFRMTPEKKALFIELGKKTKQSIESHL